MRRLIPDILISLLVLAVQTTLMPFLAIRGIIPDLLLIWIVYLAVRRGQVTGMLAGFLLGFAMDILAGADGMLGLAALAKAVAGFVAGYFYNENKIQQTLGGTMFLVAVGLSALLHNILYFLIFLQGTSLSVGSMMVQYGLPATLYAVAFALLPMFAFARKYIT
jgi:rod shape-determining protein MreD